MADTNDIQKRRAALLTSFGVNPDEVAEINRKAAGLKVPAGVVKAMPETANSRLKLNQIEAQIGGLSILPQRLSDPEFSDIAHDDISQLSEIERKRGVMTAGKEDNFFVDPYRSVARGWYTGKKNLNGLIARSDFFGLEKQREAAAKANGTYYNRNLDIAQQQAELQRDIDRYAPDATLQRQQRELGSQKTLSGSASYLVRNPSLLFNTTAESLGQNALGLAAGAATGGWAAVGAVGLSSGAQEYSATMEEVLEKHAHELGGMTPTERYAYALTREDWMEEARSKAWKRGISVGVFDAATAGVAGRLLGGATGKLSAAARTAGEAGIQAGGGAAGEAVAQAATGEYNPSAIIMEAFAEIPTGAFEARSNYKEARAQMESRQAQAKAAEEARAHLKEQAMAVTRSRMTQRDPDKQAAFVNDVYGEDQKIYFDGGALMQSGRAAAIAQAMPDMAAKIQEAAETGGMVEMTRGDFHARLTQEDQNALAEIAMETPDSMTAAEAEEIRKAGFDAMMDEAYQADLARHQEEQSQEEQDRRVAEFEAFKEEAKAQLTAAGTMDAAQAEANATLYARAVETLAGRLNMGIRDFDAAYGGLNVVGESLIDDGVLNQALASNPPRGWVHSENPQDAINIWTTDGREAAKNEAVFWTLDNAADTGIADTQGYSHSISRFAAHHIYKEHGNTKTEEERGQVAVTAEDLTRIPDIVTSPDKIVTGFQSEQGAERVAYLKRFDDGLMVYIAEASRKKKDFRAIPCGSIPQRQYPKMSSKTFPAKASTSETGRGHMTILPPTPTPIKTYCSNPQQKSNANSTKPPRNTAARRYTTKPRRTAKPN